MYSLDGRVEFLRPWNERCEATFQNLWPSGRDVYLKSTEARRSVAVIWLNPFGPNCICWGGRFTLFQLHPALNEDDSGRLKGALHSQDCFRGNCAPVLLEVD
jgi:hypothetical protein